MSTNAVQTQKNSLWGSITGLVRNNNDKKQVAPSAQVAQVAQVAPSAQVAQVAQVAPSAQAGGKRQKKYNGRLYVVRTGTRGGKYIVVKGKKVYV